MDPRGRPQTARIKFELPNPFSNSYISLSSLREKRYTVQYLRIVFEYLQRVVDKDAPLRPLIYPEDECGTIRRIPRFIPEPVFKQLQDNLHLLLPHIRNAVVIVMNVGMRASELLTLKEDCISYDKDGSPWIQYYMGKMHKEHRALPTNRWLTIKLLEEKCKPYQQEIQLLDTIPGVDKTSAQAIVAEVGTDMSVFETPERLASWTGPTQLPI